MSGVMSMSAAWRDVSSASDPQVLLWQDIAGSLHLRVSRDPQGHRMILLSEQWDPELGSYALRHHIAH
jgi:hypothetical protein